MDCNFNYLSWSSQTGLRHHLSWRAAVYDAAITTDLQRPTAEMAAVSTPTFVLQGDPTWPVLDTAAAGIARRLPNATHRIFPGEAVHGIDPGGTAAAIREFEQ
jgi:pimeloyl-ACP methyl ester carboxylesterase